MKFLTFVLAVLLVGCAAAPKKEVKLSLPVEDEGSAYVEPKKEKHPMIPQSYGTERRNGVKSDRDKLKKKREEEDPWTFELSE